MVGGFHGMLLPSGETYETFLSDGTGMPFNGPVNRLEQWSNITLSLRRTYRDCINLVQQFCQAYSSVMYCMREESGKETL